MSNYVVVARCEWTAEFDAKHTKQSIALHAISVLPPRGEHTETAVIALTLRIPSLLLIFIMIFIKSMKSTARVPAGLIRLRTAIL